MHPTGSRLSGRPTIKTDLKSLQSLMEIFKSSDATKDPKKIKRSTCKLINLCEIKNLNLV
jgi:hypothetical protein